MGNLIQALCAYSFGPWPGKVSFERLVGSKEPESELERQVSGLPLSCWAQARRSARAIEHLGIQVVAPWDLPRQILRLRQPPKALYVKGPSAVVYAQAHSIVGSRRASDGPMAWAALRAREAVEEGAQVVSGGALGIDSQAHRVCWGAGGVGVVVLGVAVDRVYPARHKALFAEILRQGGAIVSEHPPMTVTYACHHATRNRLIAALSTQLWIAEAREGSGTLHTARAALDLGVPIGVPAADIGGERGGIEWLLTQEANVTVV